MLVSWILPKNGTKKFDLQYYDTSGRLVFVRSLEELKPPKSPYEINWPLGGNSFMKFDVPLKPWQNKKRHMLDRMIQKCYFAFKKQSGWLKVAILKIEASQKKVLPFLFCHGFRKPFILSGFTKLSSLEKPSLDHFVFLSECQKILEYSYIVNLFSLSSTSRCIRCGKYTPSSGVNNFHVE